MPNAMLCAPTVFAVGDTYQIFIPFTREVITWVLVGDRRFCDHANGILRSLDPIHRIEVPMDVLDAAGAYTVVYRAVTGRAGKFPETGDEVHAAFAFRPVRGETVNAYLLSDAHNMPELPQRAGRYFGDALDLLILCGDLPQPLNAVEDFHIIYRIAAFITGGEVPVVFARGNHDTQGALAERFGDYAPTRDGKTCYTFRLGPIWGIVLDGGEDKPDDYAVYGHTRCFHDFRLEVTDFIRRVIRSREYEAEGIAHRIIVCHMPFTSVRRPPHDIEKELFAQWGSLLRELRPEVMLSAHCHMAEIWPVGGAHDDLGQPCDIIVGARPVPDEDPAKRAFTGTALTFSPSGIDVLFTDHNKAITGTGHIARRP